MNGWIALPEGIYVRVIDANQVYCIAPYNGVSFQVTARYADREDYRVVGYADTPVRAGAMAEKEWRWRES